MKLLCDIDDTIGDLITPWIRRYNRKWNDKLKIDQISDWDIALFTKKECGNKIFEIIESPKLYNYVKPVEYALEGINMFRELGFEIIYATHGTVGAAGAKFLWLQKHGFWNENDYYFECIKCKGKWLIQADLMIDDAWENIEKFQGMKLLVDRPWNRKHNFENRVKGWEEIIDNMNKFKEWKNAKNYINRR